MSEHDEQVTEDLERRLDAAFAATRPRRGFEDELWTRLRARRPWWRRLGDALERVPWGRAAAGLAALLVVGLVVTVVRSAGIHGGGGESTASSTVQAPRSTESVPGAAGPSRSDTSGLALPFGQLPAPRAAGVPQAIRAARPSALPAGAQGVSVRGVSPPPEPPGLAVYQFDPAAGPADGAILETDAVPPGLPMGMYPSLSAAAAVAAAEAGTTSGATVVLTQARLVYVAVVSGSQGYLEPAYLFTGSEGSTPVQLLVSALAPSALR